LRSYTDGQSEVPVQGSTVGEAMRDLIAQHPALQPHLFSSAGELRPFVNLFVGEHNVRDLQGLETSINSDDRVLLIPSIAGG
jgi:molybdopterin converting factor small subunit